MTARLVSGVSCREGTFSTKPLDLFLGWSQTFTCLSLCSSTAVYFFFFFFFIYALCRIFSCFGTCSLGKNKTKLPLKFDRSV